MRESAIALDTETMVRGFARDLTRPAAGECVACYVLRMLNEFGCDTTLRFVGNYRTEAVPRATALERRFGQRGGYCDCEIFLNVLEPARHLWSPPKRIEHDGWVELIEAEPPSPMPPCAEVSRSSSQACANWARQPRYR